MIRVLVVDDSAFMRQAVTRALRSDPTIEVVGVAADGVEALAQARRLRPDVLTLDIEMPRMDGLTALATLMRTQPLPVVMLSTLTTAGAPATVRALELGAVDFVAKPGGPVAGLGGLADHLVTVVRQAAWARVRRPLPAEPNRPLTALLRRGATGEPAASPSDLNEGPAPDRRPGPVAPPARGGEHIVAIGCSTGGPRALFELLPRLPRNLPAGVVIVQHMPAGFTRALADRLDQLSPLRVREAEEGDRPEPGLALLAPGGRHLVLDSRGRVALTDAPPLHGVRPAADPCFASLPAHYGRRIVAAVLTGMGSDGADGAAAIQAAGGHVIVEDATTAVVYGMPRAVVERGLAERSLPLPAIAGAIVDRVVRAGPASAPQRRAG